MGMNIYGAILLSLLSPLCLTSVAISSTYQNIYGEKKDSQATSIIETSDKGFAITGWTTDFDVKTQDEVVVKVAKDGALMWVKTIGQIIGQIRDRHRYCHTETNN